MSAYHFFMRHAGYSYIPTVETPLKGRIRCAKALAKAEADARDHGYSFQWSIDWDTTSADWSDEELAYSVWRCVMRDSDGRITQALGGIDFGNGGVPWGDPYRRVVEAELACEEFAQP